MSLYYLISQLPSLDGIGETEPLPITEEAFLELCSRFLGKEGYRRLQNLSLTPPRAGSAVGSRLLDAWNQNERLLRLALGAVRSARLGKPFETDDMIIPAPLTQAAQAAVGMEDPLAAERYLNQYRMTYLEQLRPLDSFCEDMVMYYGLKLKLLLRLRQFDAAKGWKAYRNIYNSILNGDSQENE